jgi:hypothetical protein
MEIELFELNKYCLIIHEIVIYVAYRNCTRKYGTLVNTINNILLIYRINSSF